MKRVFSLIVAAVFVASLVPPANAQTEAQQVGTAYAQITNDRIVLGNALVERRWQRQDFRTTQLIDKRNIDGVTGGGTRDFRLLVGTTEIGSESFDVAGAAATPIEGGLRLTIELASPTITATRVVDVYEGIAGFRTQMTITPLTPMALRGYTLDEANVGDSVSTTIHAFRAGADWREPTWSGPAMSLGDKHAGTWRDTRAGGPGQAIDGAAQWISSANGGHSLFMVMERNDWPSSRAAYSGGTSRLIVDYSADLIILGPFEEDAHAENPRAGQTPGRHRPLEPLTPFALEGSFTGFGTDPDDEPWQFYKYLTGHRLDPYDSEITFNTNGTDDNIRSDGAKDDAVEEVIAEVAPKARRLGIETFILDDGWQARSGDWEPDCGTAAGQPNTDPRWDGSSTSKFRPRYTDCTFSKVRELIAPMELGLWMSPMHFHPRSATYLSHPEWACKPVGDGVGALSLITPSGGSNDAGLGTWSTHPDLMAHVQSRIQNAIDRWGVTYFKFDFLVWLDCAGQGDMYDYKEAFMAMVDRLITSNPEVTFEIDETNDYRLFPFESVTRGPSWFQNGSPSPDRLLHNLWNLSPYVPAYSLGQHFLGGIDWTRVASETRAAVVDRSMAIALPSHLTFFSDLRKLPDEVADLAKPWADFYAANRQHFTQMTYPLLSDPIVKDWTALQTWDPEQAHGALLAFRQESVAPTKTIALRNVPPGMAFDLVEAPTGNHFGTFTSEQLSTGIEIPIATPGGARVFVISPVQVEEFDPTTTLTYSGETVVKIGDSFSLEAALVGSDGPIPGASLAFTFRGVTYLATTGSDGRAVVRGIKATGPPGPYEVLVSYAGSDRYRASATQATVSITAGRIGSSQGASQPS